VLFFNIFIPFSPELEHNSIEWQQQQWSEEERERECIKNYLHKKVSSVHTERERGKCTTAGKRNYFEMEYHFIIVSLLVVADGREETLSLFVGLHFSTVPLPDAAAEFTSWFLNFSTRD
jgi:hypothetical protein